MEKLVNAGGVAAGKFEGVDFLKIKNISKLAYSFQKTVFWKSEF